MRRKGDVSSAADKRPIAKTRRSHSTGHRAGSFVKLAVAVLAFLLQCDSPIHVNPLFHSTELSLGQEMRDGEFTAAPSNSELFLRIQSPALLREAYGVELYRDESLLWSDTVFLREGKLRINLPAIKHPGPYILKLIAQGDEAAEYVVTVEEPR